MPKLTWDEVGTKRFENGVSQGALYLQKDDGTYEKGVAWSGLINVNQNPDGAEETVEYADNIKYLSIRSAENFKGSISAYTYPDEFELCEGAEEIETGIYVGQQSRRGFGLVYKTEIGNDVNQSLGQKLHIVYSAKVAPSAREYATINDSPSGVQFSWDFSTTPIPIPGFKPSAKITLDQTKCDKKAWDAINDMCFGTDSEEAKLPLPQDVIDLASGALI